VICTEPFETLAGINARARQIPDVDLMIVPHPLGSRAPDEITGLARDVAQSVLSLVEPPVAARRETL
jgi:hypothetical protein